MTSSSINIQNKSDLNVYQDGKDCEEVLPNVDKKPVYNKNLPDLNSPDLKNSVLFFATKFYADDSLNRSHV